MAWSTPQTWNDGTTVNAATLNAQVRDNLNALQARIQPGTAVVGSSPISATLMTLKTLSLASYVTDGSGFAQVTYPGGAFANGVQSVMVSLGNATSYVVEADFATATLASCPVKVFNPATGAAATGVAVFLNFWVVGW